MTNNIINDAQTIAGGNTAGAMLAGRYRIVRQLGQGGMGSVWLAEDTQLDGKQFAIKMLPSILALNKRAYRQLKDEALVAMKLTHPNIVTLRAFEENSGNPFLVMDYIDGQTLDDYLAEKGKLSEEEAIRVLRPIAVALDYAHGKGVVHRDVKPANVMIAKDDTPFILDFGIAREIQETLTRVTGKLSSGTLLYMSPEQLHGAMPRKEQDIYSFAAMVYECLKGEPPFCRGQIEHQIDNDMPEPLPGGPHSCAAAIMVGLAKKPEDRPKSCAAVLEVNVSRRASEAQSGGARRLAEPVGSRVPRDRDDAPQSGRRVPTPPNEDDLSRKEHKERKGSGIGKVLGILALFAALGGGAWYYRQQQEAARREQSRIAAERKAQEEVERLAAAKAEAERQAEQARIAAEKAEAERKAQEEAERLAEAKAEAERKAQEEAERLAAAKAEAERQAEQARIAVEKTEAERKPKEEAARKAREEMGKDAAANKDRKPGEEMAILLPGDVNMVFCWCPPGEFMMGSPLNEKGRFLNEQEPHRVVITNGFWIGKYEVTCAQWDSIFPEDKKGSGNFVDYPVENVSWLAVSNYVEKLNSTLRRYGDFNLPTEEQWEYAYRANSTTPYICGQNVMPHDANKWGNMGTDGRQGNRHLATRAGNFPANAWGLHDMAGNVREWCLNDVSGRKVTRGGGWRDHPRRCRAASRIMRSPRERDGYTGFRLICQSIKGRNEKVKK